MRCHLSVFLLAFVGPFALVLASDSEDQDLARARSEHSATIGRLDDALEQARRLHRAGVEAAHRKLLAACQDAIVRALDAGDKPAVERLRREMQEIASQVPRSLETVAQEDLFECVLGTEIRQCRRAKKRRQDAYPLGQHG